tara:strand:+ start:88 stop:294 length:207 start_codon:yes stop_codon:yes gene_type:complete
MFTHQQIFQVTGSNEKANLDLYTDYLFSTLGAATATGFPVMVDGQISHDQVPSFYPYAITTPKICGYK